MNVPTRRLVIVIVALTLLYYQAFLIWNFIFYARCYLSGVDITLKIFFTSKINLGHSWDIAREKCGL
jgi:hypothetical protein